MTDRINGLTVVLDHDYRDDDCQSLINAIKQLRGVVSVTPNVGNVTEHIAYERARHDLTTELWNVLKPKGC